MVFDAAKAVAFFLREFVSPLQTFVAKHLTHRPLKVGIAAGVPERCPDIDRRDLAAALAAYTHLIAYLQAIIAGADRIDLDGVTAGQVTAAEAEHAAVVLTERSWRDVRPSGWRQLCRR